MSAAADPPTRVVKCFTVVGGNDETDLTDVLQHLCPDGHVPDSLRLDGHPSSQTNTVSVVEFIGPDGSHLDVHKDNDTKGHTIFVDGKPYSSNVVTGDHHNTHHKHYAHTHHKHQIPSLELPDPFAEWGGSDKSLEIKFIKTKEGKTDVNVLTSDPADSTYSAFAFYAVDTAAPEEKAAAGLTFHSNGAVREYRFPRKNAELVVDIVTRRYKEVKKNAMETAPRQTVKYVIRPTGEFSAHHHNHGRTPSTTFVAEFVPKATAQLADDYSDDEDFEAVSESVETHSVARTLRGDESEGENDEEYDRGSVSQIDDASSAFQDVGDEDGEVPDDNFSEY